MTFLAILGALCFVSLASANICVVETNAARTNNGRLPPLSNNAQLVAAAKYHNDWMVRTGCFSHQCDGEPDLGARVTSTGYKWRSIAENLAAGTTSCQQTVTSWLGSPGHKANILSSQTQVGCVSGTYTGPYRTFWTCVYATPM